MPPLLKVKAILQRQTQTILPPPQGENSNGKTDEKNLQKVQLGKSTAIAERELETYNSGAQVNRHILESIPNGNGDIGSVLKILPNVQFDNAQGKSSTAGEIDLASISISGGLFFQNNFQLDGFNINNDINPMGNKVFGSSNHQQWGSTASQGLPVDTSLLESITVLDSNVSAAYGRFTGGVVEANVRKPRQDDGGIKGWHGNISYQITQGNAMPSAFSMTRYHIHELEWENFINSTSEYYQPEFIKHAIRANVEGYATKNLGIIASFSTIRSYIPLFAYSESYSAGTEAGGKKDQKRVSDNYYIKAHYNPNENLTIEANIAYMPQDNTYYRPNVKDSYFDLQSGGIQSGVKALYTSPIGLLTTQLGYNFMQSSRDSQSNFWATWRYSEGDKNWAYSPTTTRRTVSQGGFGDMEQTSHTLNFKSDFDFGALELLGITHNFKVGGEAGFNSAMRNRANGYYIFSGYNLNGLGRDYVANLNGGSCGVDSLGLTSCSEATTNYGGINYNETWRGQYFNQVRAHAPGKNVFNTLSYGIYAEDDMGVDLGKVGELNTRLGLRLDGDNYMSKHTLAPRFSTSYKTPVKQDWRTQLTFGANRYYGRNMLTYRIYDADNAEQSLKYYYRTSAQSDWILSQADHPITSTIFSKLKVPYDDELMVGLTQNLGIFSMSVKYIHRDGKDQIYRTRRDFTIPRPDESHSSTSYIYSNGGKSRTDVIALTLQNIKPIITHGVAHNYLFSFDYTQSKRDYNPYLTSTDYNANLFDLVLCEGKPVFYGQCFEQPENFVRPWTLRFTTTHAFVLKRTKWIINNFFRFRSGYNRRLQIWNKQYKQYQTSRPNIYQQYQGPGFDAKFDYLDQYATREIKWAFNWDMRVGTEYFITKNGHTIYVNVDINNVLNLRNETTLTTGSANLDGGGNVASAYNANALSYTAKAYELGRQFWVQVGYKF